MGEFSGNRQEWEFFQAVLAGDNSLIRQSFFASSITLNLFSVVLSRHLEFHNHANSPLAQFQKTNPQIEYREGRYSVLKIRVYIWNLKRTLAQSVSLVRSISARSFTQIIYNHSQLVKLRVNRIKQMVYYFLTKLAVRRRLMSWEESQRLKSMGKNSKELTPLSNSSKERGLVSLYPEDNGDAPRLVSQHANSSGLHGTDRQPQIPNKTGADSGKRTDRSTGRQSFTDKDRILNAESLLVGGTSRARLSTQELIPSFREKYEIYELIQEVSDTKRRLQLKNKQIFYLSNQIVSIKDEYSQRILQLEATIAENKRELTQLRYAGLKNKRIESERGDRVLEESKKNYELQIHNIKEVQEELMRKLQGQHIKQKENMQEKFISILNLEKRERSSVEELYEEKYRNYEILVRQLQDQIRKLLQQREAEGEVSRQQQNAVEVVKKEFLQFSEQASELQKNMRIEIGQLESKLAVLQENADRTNKQKLAAIQASRTEIYELEQSNQLLKDEIVQLKKLLSLKDKQMEKLLLPNVRSHKSKDKAVDPVRACTHQGLIQQLERNLSLRNKENQELREQLNQWGKYIGFDRTSQERTIDLLNASSEALQTQQSFASSLRKKVGKFGN